jgi:hypothetical protein
MYETRDKISHSAALAITKLQDSGGSTQLQCRGYCRRMRNFMKVQSLLPGQSLLFSADGLKDLVRGLKATVND